MHASDLPIIPLKCDGMCVSLKSDETKRKKYLDYIHKGGIAWARSCVSKPPRHQKK